MTKTHTSNPPATGARTRSDPPRSHVHVHRLSPPTRTHEPATRSRNSPIPTPHPPRLLHPRPDQCPRAQIHAFKLLERGLAAHKPTRAHYSPTQIRRLSCKRTHPHPTHLRARTHTAGSVASSCAHTPLTSGCATSTRTHCVLPTHPRAPTCAPQPCIAGSAASSRAH